MRDIKMQSCFGERTSKVVTIGNYNPLAKDRSAVNRGSAPQELEPVPNDATDEVVMRRPKSNTFRNLRQSLSLHLGTDNSVCISSSDYINSRLGLTNEHKSDAKSSPSTPLDVKAKFKDFRRRLRSENLHHSDESNCSSEADVTNFGVPYSTSTPVMAVRSHTNLQPTMKNTNCTSLPSFPMSPISAPVTPVGAHINAPFPPLDKSTRPVSTTSFEVKAKLKKLKNRFHKFEEGRTHTSGPTSPEGVIGTTHKRVEFKEKLKEWRYNFRSEQNIETDSSDKESKTKRLEFRHRIRSDDEAAPRKSVIGKLRRTISASLPTPPEEEVSTVKNVDEAANGGSVEEIVLRKKPRAIRPHSMLTSLRRSITISFPGDVRSARKNYQVPDDFHRSVLSFSTKNKASEDTWHGTTPQDVPLRSLDVLEPDVFTSYTGPDEGLVLIHNLLKTDQDKDQIGAKDWKTKSRKAYGISASLYDQHPVNGKISGDPIADSFAVCARMNNALLVIADGVNWGEKSKTAARCAVYGCVKYMNEKLFKDEKPVTNTREAMQSLLDSFWAAHRTILKLEGGLTTLCAALVLPLAQCRQFVVCTVNVGDSLAFVFSKYHGIREITVGSHDTTTERDIRDAGGALGPVDGDNPELHNLTCSMTVIDPGDILYLTTDGISDNFDPVVTKIAAASRRHSVPSTLENNLNLIGTKPEMSPNERHRYSVKEMERIVHEFELDTEQPVSAQELCGAMLQHVLKLTDPKRKILENPELYGKKMRSKERKRRDSQIVEQMSLAAGKLDHATVVAYEVGYYHGNDDENYEIDDDDEEEDDIIHDDEAFDAPTEPKRALSPVLQSPSGETQRHRESETMI